MRSKSRQQRRILPSWYAPHVGVRPHVNPRFSWALYRAHLQLLNLLGRGVSLAELAPAVSLLLERPERETQQFLECISSLTSLEEVLSLAELLRGISPSSVRSFNFDDVTCIYSSVQVSLTSICQSALAKEIRSDALGHYLSLMEHSSEQDRADCFSFLRTTFAQKAKENGELSSSLQALLPLRRELKQFISLSISRAGALPAHLAGPEYELSFDVLALIGLWEAGGPGDQEIALQGFVSIAKSVMSTRSCLYVCGPTPPLLEISNRA